MKAHHRRNVDQYLLEYRQKAAKYEMQRVRCSFAGAATRLDVGERNFRRGNFEAASPSVRFSHRSFSLELYPRDAGRFNYSLTSPVYPLAFIATPRHFYGLHHYRPHDFSPFFRKGAYFRDKTRPKSSSLIQNRDLFSDGRLVMTELLMLPRNPKPFACRETSVGEIRIMWHATEGKRRESTLGVSERHALVRGDETLANRVTVESDEKCQLSETLRDEVVFSRILNIFRLMDNRPNRASCRHLGGNTANQILIKEGEREFSLAPAIMHLLSRGIAKRCITPFPFFSSPIKLMLADICAIPVENAKRAA